MQVALIEVFRGLCGGFQAIGAEQGIAVAQHRPAEELAPEQLHPQLLGGLVAAVLSLQAVQLGGHAAWRQAAIGQPGRQLGRILAADHAVARFLVLMHALGFPQVIAQPRQGRRFAAGKRKGGGRHPLGFAKAQAGQGRQRLHQAGRTTGQRRQALGGGARLEDMQARFQQIAELIEDRGQLGQWTGQLFLAQQVVARQLGQRHLQRLAHPAQLIALVGRHLFQGQHFIQAQVLQQGGNHQFGAALHHHQPRAMLAQARIQRRQAFQQETRAMHAEPARAEGRGTQQVGIEDIEWQQALRLEPCLERRVIVEPEILLQPEQRAAHGGLPRRGLPLPTTLPAAVFFTLPFIPADRPHVR
ncbi:hypothetical protein D9M72_385390 [compost metagenome]